MKYFPHDENRDIYNNNLTIQLYGHRIHESQTVGEYLLEFLLVYFGSTKSIAELVLYEGSEISYKIYPSMGLKRFVFLENSKMINRFRIDEGANQELNSLMKKSIISDDLTSEDALNVIKDLFYGYSLVTRQRGWFAQSLLPLGKNLIFCEAMGIKSVREQMKFVTNGKINKNVDSEFGFTQHNFLARGGEVYFLHTLQGFKELQININSEESNKISREIQEGLKHLISRFPQLDKLSSYIQTTWELNLVKKTDCFNNIDEIHVHHTRTMNCEFIKDSYKNDCYYTMLELRFLLNTDMSTFDKLELLNIGIVMQLFRLMTGEAYRISSNKSEGRPIWLIHIPSNSVGDEKVKKLAVKHYSELENYMTNALSNQLNEKNKYSENYDASRNIELDELKDLKNAYDDSHKLLRKIGKEIGFVIPATGINMRLTLSDSIIRFLVISMIEPAQKITLDRFLDKLFDHFGIVIREKEYSKFNGTTETINYAPYLKYNYESFVFQLKANGFLKELSDATAIVENPYLKVKEQI